MCMFHRVNVPIMKSRTHALGHYPLMLMLASAQCVSSGLIVCIGYDFE